MNHCQLAADPKLPPDKVKVEAFPLQIVPGEPEILVGAVEGVETITVTLVHGVVLQIPEAKSQ